MLIKDSTVVRDILKNKKLLKGRSVIFSMWDGYLKKDFWDKNKVNIIKLHTSGHAYVRDLKTFVKAIKPKRIIPIHTECGEMYGQLFNTKVIRIEDKEEYVL